MKLLCEPQFENLIHEVYVGDVLFKEIKDVTFTELPHIKGVLGDAQYLEAFALINTFSIPIPIRLISNSRGEFLAIWTSFLKDMCTYERSMQPPFLSFLTSYCDRNKVHLATPGHHKGAFFKSHPTGIVLMEMMGEPVFHLDVSSSDEPMGDPVIHEGPTLKAEKIAARVFGADKTYFLVNGTSGANKSVCSALLQPGDVVLFDRNNHKSLYQGALTQIGVKPIFLETLRSPEGIIEGITSSSLEVDYIRKELENISISSDQQINGFKDKKRPIRLAILQHSTYDGLIYNVESILHRIGHLCDYILFDAAWLGYEKAIDLPSAYQPLAISLKSQDPGIFVTQSVHKQMAGLSQCSQLHKKDSHIKNQRRYCHDYLVDHGAMLHASTSPFYPFIGIMEANAIMHDGPLGRHIWSHAKELAQSAKKEIENVCTYVSVYRYEGDGMMMQDPCKITLITRGVTKKGTYEEFGIPAIILSSYLIERGIVPEKCGNHTILLLFTPGDKKEDVQTLIEVLQDFENAIDKEISVKELLPSLYEKNREYYESLTIKTLICRMHQFYKERQINYLEQKLFNKKYLPPMAMSSKDANYAFIGGKGKWVYIEEAKGKIALESAIAYPPGIVLVNSGEIWTKEAIDYFLALEELANNFPGFIVEVQGLRYAECEKRLKLVTAVM